MTPERSSASRCSLSEVPTVNHVPPSDPSLCFLFPHTCFSSSTLRIRTVSETPQRCRQVQPFNFNATSGFSLSPPRCLCLSATRVHSCGHSLVTHHTRSFSQPVPTSLYKRGQYSNACHVTKKLKLNVCFFSSSCWKQKAEG